MKPAVRKAIAETSETKEAAISHEESDEDDSGNGESDDQSKNITSIPKW